MKVKLDLPSYQHVSFVLNGHQQKNLLMEKHGLFNHVKFNRLHQYLMLLEMILIYGLILIYVTLEYLRNTLTTFSQRNIRVTIRVNPAKGETVVWNAIPGEEYDGNLLGTLRTLDGNRDSKLELDCRNQPHKDLHCTYGVISRRGYALVDDTHQPQLDNDPQWPWIINKQYSPPDPNLCQAVPTSERRNCGSFKPN